MTTQTTTQTTPRALTKAEARIVADALADALALADLPPEAESYPGAVLVGWSNAGPFGSRIPGPWMPYAYGWIPAEARPFSCLPLQTTTQEEAASC